MPGASESQTGSTLLVLLRAPDDPEAWKAFVARYAPRVLAWCRQWELQPADAQDVTQEVLYRLVGQLRRFPYDPAKGHFRGWLKGVARHAWSDLRDGRRRAGWGSGDPHVLRLLEAQEDRDGLLEALDQEFERELYEEALARGPAAGQPRDLAGLPAVGPREVVRRPGGRQAAPDGGVRVHGQAPGPEAAGGGGPPASGARPGAEGG